ncbi:MAG: DNA-binding response regulator [Geobacter sp.]|nr:MAG: DNA-binding response regulator [Geobacter sp.]
MGILIIEDDKKIAELIKRRLEAEQYKVTVEYDGEKGFRTALDEFYNLIILNLILPKKDGLSLIKDLRVANVTTPVLILSTKNTVEDIVTGLDVGADDYLPKPFAFVELLARVQALLRRSKQERGAEIRFAELRLDPITRKAWCKEKEIHLTLKEHALLEFFIRNPNQVLSRSAIVENVWPDMITVKFTNIVNVYASFLRKKIDKVTGRNLIHTVPGIGYILKET